MKKKKNAEKKGGGEHKHVVDSIKRFRAGLQNPGLTEAAPTKVGVQGGIESFLLPDQATTLTRGGPMADYRANEGLH